jgi:hypothetical protein
MTKALEESFSLDKFETSVIEKVAAVPIFMGKPRAKLWCWINSFCSNLCHTMEMILDAV